MMLRTTGQLTATSENNIKEYSSCNFRFDINVAKRSLLSMDDSYSILMRLKTRDGNEHTFNLDATTLKFLHDELDRISLSFPKCYVYK